MEFSPANPIVKLCLQGMVMEEKNETVAAERIYMQAWDEASNDFEKFLAAYYIARCQQTASLRLKWYETALSKAPSVNTEAVTGAYPSLYEHIASCYEELGEHAKAADNRKLAESYRSNPADKGPFYHGTRADMQVGDCLVAGFNSNYKDDLRMNHIYFTAVSHGAGLAAALAKGDGNERVYIVEPTGSYENDPNVTDKKFPGNPTRSYRTTEPLKIVGELTEWVRQTPEQIQQWRERLANSNGEIIN